ncbi:MAG: hypothetical protein Q8M20_06435 [Rhodocyclaceae bacterium]|nr:hypothetical protein [Rhodocyclaceae bacterium]MDZ4214462.1 hypothetical protein [Rhodocyclaceae bacterium]
MALTNVLVGTVTDGNGMTVEIYATETSSGFSLTVKVVEGFADLRGFFLDGAAATGSSLGALDTNLAKDVNMNGTGTTFDSAYEIGTAGAGKDDIGEITFNFTGSLTDLNTLDFGIRATSVGATADSRGDSVKLVGQFDIPEPTPVDNFPTMDKDISHITLYFDVETGNEKYDEDGVYTVKIDTPSSFDDNLDNSIGKILDYVIANDPYVTSADQLSGVAIKGGNVDHGGYDNYYAMDGNPDADNDQIPTTDGTLAQNKEVDATISYDAVFGVA